ncbi:MAG: hypothetical protein WC314_07185 [Vulcanimicrobiota bacterium]
MMKAAYEYYRQNHKATRKVTNTVTLGSLNTNATARVSLKKRPPRKPAPQLTSAEQALLKLVDSGMIGAVIAYHAPPAQDF